MEKPDNLCPSFRLKPESMFILAKVKMDSGFRCRVKPATAPE
jgi:hypothetical protein